MNYWKNKQGFTLVQLGIVLVIIFILAIMSVPRFADLIRKSKENETKIELSNLRNALHSYYEQNGGNYPIKFNDDKFVGKYIDQIPKVRLGKYHKDSSEIKINDGLDDFGGWYYDSESGEIKVNCKHKDTKGQIINKW
jgi:type IV pilus assembly protein PilA